MKLSEEQIAYVEKQVRTAAYLRVEPKQRIYDAAHQIGLILTDVGVFGGANSQRRIVKAVEKAIEDTEELTEALFEAGQMLAEHLTDLGKIQETEEVTFDG